MKKVWGKRGRHCYNIQYYSVPESRKTTRRKSNDWTEGGEAENVPAVVDTGD